MRINGSFELVTVTRSAIRGGLVPVMTQSASLVIADACSMVIVGCSL